MRKFCFGKYVGLLLLLLGFVGGSADKASAYQNPAIGLEHLGDPSVFRHQGRYYAVAGVSHRVNHIGIACWSSPDLVNWRAEGWIFLVTSNTWAQYHLNSAEVHERNGKFYLFFSARHTLNTPMSVCVAESTTGPTGPYYEISAPLFFDTDDAFDPHVFQDTDGRCYIYYATYRADTYISLNVREIDPSLQRMVQRKAFQNIVAHPYAGWEQTSWLKVAESPNVIKRNGVYYLIYSGNWYQFSSYAVGYATSNSPFGPFVRHPGNPIMKADMTSDPPVSGPGSGHVIPSPDGTELFYLYNAHTNPAAPSADRSLYIDRMSFASDGTLSIHGPTVTCQLDPSTGGPGSTPTMTCPEPFVGIPTTPIGSDGSTGWFPLHTQQEGLAWTGINENSGAIVAHVVQHPWLNRRTGVISHQSSWLPYSEIGPDNYVRAEFAIYRANQKDPSDLTQVPNVRLRCANRFAYANILEVYHHLAQDPGSKALLQEMIPSADPARPSVYKVDFDPIDVPVLAQTAGEGVMRAFEAYSLEPQENGDLVLVESSIRTYPRDLLPDSATTDILKKVYEPGASDAGALKSIFPTDLQRHVEIIPIFEGFRQWPDTSGTPLPTYQEAGYNSTNPPPGVTFDTTAIPSNRLGIVVRDFFPGADRTASDYVRIEPGRQYKIRWHLTSTVPANRNANIRLRTRTAKWGWNFKTEIGGAFAAGNTNNAIAQQVLPGIGCMNPDKIGNENGGWYTQLVTIPLDPAIRPDFPEGTPLEQRMPLLSAQPGPGVDAPSLKDLKFGMDLLDTLDISANYELEQGNVTLDRIEVRSYPAVP